MLRNKSTIENTPELKSFDLKNQEVNELVIIARNFKHEWTEDAIRQAKNELKKRNISEKKQERIYEEYLKEFGSEWKNELEKRKTEDFSLFDKLWLIVFWFRPQNYGWNYKKNGYLLMSRRNKQLIFIGILIYGIIGIYSFSNWRIEQKKGTELIEKMQKK